MRHLNWKENYEWSLIECYQTFPPIPLFSPIFFFSFSENSPPKYTFIQNCCLFGTLHKVNTLVDNDTKFLGGLFGNCLTIVSGLDVLDFFVFSSSRNKVFVDLKPSITEYI